MRLEVVATLFAIELTAELGVPTPVDADPTEQLFTFSASRTCQLVLDRAELERMKAEVDATAPPIPLARAGAARFVIGLFSGMLDHVIAQRAEAIRAVLKPHAQRYAEQMRPSLELPP